jgi:hypothetical protein
MKDTVRQGVVDWTGDNPFIYLKTDLEGDWTSLSLCFRVALSRFGPGRAILVLDQPYQPEARNAVRFCLTDNLPLAQYLIADFVKKFGLFRPSAALLDRMLVVPGATFRTEADGNRQAETATAGGYSIAMIWEGLRDAFAVDVPPDKSQTGIHEMFSVFCPAASARVEVNGKALSGTTVERDFFDRRAQSAALAHSETWVRFG